MREAYSFVSKIAYDKVIQAGTDYIQWVERCKSVGNAATSAPVSETESGQDLRLTGQLVRASGGEHKFRKVDCWQSRLLSRAVPSYA